MSQSSYASGLYLLPAFKHEPPQTRLVTSSPLSQGGTDATTTDFAFAADKCVVVVVETAFKEKQATLEACHVLRSVIRPPG